MGSKKPQTSVSESKPWAPAIPHLEKILANAGDLFDAQGGINAEWLDKEIADLNPQLQETLKNMVNSQGFKDLAGNIGNMTQQGISGIGQSAGMLGGLAQQGITSDQINAMAKDFYQSDVVKSQTEQLTKNVQEGLNKNIQGLNQQASSAGNMGSSRAGVAEGVAVGKAGEAIAEGSANIENAARQQAMGQAIGTLQGNQQTALGAAGQLGQLGLGAGNLQAGLGGMYQQILGNQLQAGMIGQNQAQNILNNKWFNQQGQQNMGWNQLGKYMGLAGAIGGMGGTTTNTVTGGGPSGFNQLLGTAATLGGAFLGGPGGAAVGNAMFGNSDASMKKNVKATGKKTKKGEREYTWEWNKAGKKAGEKGKGKGVLAQEVAKSKPDAVKTNPKTGKLMVDYAKV